MVNYSIDNNSRQTTYFIIAITTVIITIAISRLLVTIDFNIVAPSTMIIYGILLWVFDNYLWDKKILNWLVRIPNLNGVWKGVVIRTVDGKLENINVELNINQKWNKIDLVLESPTTISNARNVGFITANENLQTISWGYTVRSKNALEKENKHGEGVTELRLYHGDSIELKGFYYSNKLQKGSIELVKE